MAIRGSSLAGAIIPVGGPAGLTGQSTYAAWRALGNTGSLADFIAAQRGADGKIQSFLRPDGTLVSKAQLTLDDIQALAKTGSLNANKVTPPGQVEQDLPGALAQFKQALTGSFWSDQPTPARIQRLADRILGGGAVLYDGTLNPSGRTWVGTGMGAQGNLTYVDQYSQMAIYSTIGSLAIAGASRTSDGTPGTVAIGLGGYAYADKADLTGGAWGVYGLAVRGPGGGSTLGFEVNVANLDPTPVAANPFLLGQAGTTVAGWFRAGGEVSESGAACYPTSAAIGIVRGSGKNGAAGPRHDRGIVHSAEAYTLQPDSLYYAMQMAPLQAVCWAVDGGGGAASGIYGNADSTLTLFANGGAIVPAADQATDLGSSTKHWRSLFAHVVNLGGYVGSGGASHVRLFDAGSENGSYGFGVVAGQLVHNAGSGAGHSWRSNGLEVASLSANGDVKVGRGFGIFNVTPVTTRPTLQAALPTDGSASNASIATIINSIRSAMISYGLAQ